MLSAIPLNGVTRQTLGGLPELLGIPKRWLDECVTLKDNTFPQLRLMRFSQVHSTRFSRGSALRFRFCRLKLRIAELPEHKSEYIR